MSNSKFSIYVVWSGHVWGTNDPAIAASFAEVNEDTVILHPMAGIYVDPTGEETAVDEVEVDQTVEAPSTSGKLF